MYTFSTEPPFKDSLRIAGVLHISDVHRMRAKVTHEDPGETVVSWMQDMCHFHLVARHKSGVVTWQLYFSKALGTALIMQSTNADTRRFFEELSTKTSEVSRAERKLSGSKAALPASASQAANASSPTVASITDKEWVSALCADRVQGTDEDVVRCALMAKAFLQDALTYTRGLAQLSNEITSSADRTITVSDVGDVEERIGELQTRVTYTRWRAATLHWCMSARVRKNEFELFLVPSAEAVFLSMAETESARQINLHCTVASSCVKWWNATLPVTALEMRILIRSAFEQLVRHTAAEIAQMQTGNRAHTLIPAHETEKQMLAQKIINQQEQLQRQIARDLHDAVIADITVLKRALEGEEGAPPIAPEDIARSLDEIATRLREICYDLSPTDLRDWGLRTTLEALVEQASQRVTASCTITCPEEMPELDGSVDLHIFRILQESLNNVVKYAQATEIKLAVHADHDGLTFTLTDNGKGMESTGPVKQARHGGMGMAGMQERIGIIRSYYPATLTVRSQPERGTITTLTIQLPSEP